MTYRCIMADPPWAERGGGRIKRGADRHYPVIETCEIAKVMLRAPCWRPATDAHLWLWVTNNFLPDGLALMERLGFRYVTNVAWVKMRNEPAIHTDDVQQSAHDSLQIGLGQYFRGAHELLLFGTRGKAFVPGTADRYPSVIFEERGRHSVKPGWAYELATSVSHGPYLEMFAREPRRGWDVWGNQVDSGSTQEIAQTQ